MFFVSVNYSNRILALVLSSAGLVSAQSTRDPETNLVVPSAGQLAWHHDEMGVFFHMNPTYPVGTMTFANFNPAALVDAAISVGAKHIVLVAKHGDGFCWWPTLAVKPGETQSSKSIARTQYKNGSGNVVREVFDEARRRGLRVGIYLATIDTHFGAEDGGSYPADQPAYNNYYVKQATELATQYGEIAEWWLDGGAIPSLGAAINSVLATHQPNAVVFQGTDATLRWVGNEDGIAPYPSWNTISQADQNLVVATGGVVTNGNPDGVHWTPPEVDTPLSTGWFDGGPRALSDLTNVFYQSIGHGAGLLLNFPVQTDGTISTANRARGVELGQVIDSAVGHPLFSLSDKTGNQILEFGVTAEIDHVIVKEDLRYGERIRQFTIDGWDGAQWRSIVTDGTAIGEKQIRKFTPASYSKVRLTVTKSVGTPLIRSFAVSRTGVQASDITPPIVPQGLAASVVENQVALTWQASADPETGVAQYRIYRDNAMLGNSTQTNFIDNRAPESLTLSYQVSAINGNGLESPRSAAVPVATLRDQTKPTLLSATTLPGRTNMTVVFSEPLDATQASIPSHFRMSHGRSITAAAFNATSPDRVVITVDQALSPDILYTLRVDGIKDTAAIPNGIATDSKISFRINSFGMIRHWKCDDASGTILKDNVTSGTAPGNNGQVSGTTWTTDGKIGGALSFDGSAHADTGGAGLQANFTLALWVRVQSNASFQTLVGKERNGVQAYQQRLYLNNLKPGFIISDQSGSSLGLWPFEAATALPLNAWTHLAVTSQNGVFKMYINGTLALTKDLGAMIQSPYNPVNMLLGARWNSTATAKVDYFTGQLDDVRIHTEALTTAEIQRVVVEATTTAPADTDGDEISDAWEIKRAGNLTKMNATSDSDGDGHLDIEEYLADTNPFETADSFRITNHQAVLGNPNQRTLTWSSKPTRIYRIEISPDLTTWADSGLGTIQPAAGLFTTATAPTAIGNRRFFRVLVTTP